MEALQVLEYAFNHGRGLDFAVGSSKEDELRMLDDVVGDACAVQTDVRFSRLSTCSRVIADATLCYSNYVLVRNAIYE
jgi:hypothetical protein